MGRFSRVPLIGTLVLVFAIAVAWAMATRGDRHGSISREVARELSLSANFAERIDHSLDGSGDSLSAVDAVAATYLERLELGLGSPFRLIEYALEDRMLSDSVRRLVAYAMLDRTRRGDTYHAPSLVLSLVGTQGPLSAELAKEHVTLVERTVENASDPRGGELAVREAYRLAAAAGSVGPRGPWLGAQVAALARDRVLARRDVERLLDMARRNRIDPLGLIPVWRLERRFSVERPLMDPLAANVERNALSAVGDLARDLDSLATAARRSAVDSTELGVQSAPRVSDSAARRLAWIAATRAAPPQAPVVVAVTSTVRPPRFVATVDVDAGLREALVRFGQRAVNEETLAAEYAVFAARDTLGEASPSLAVLWAAVSMRAYAQERVWFPGYGGPTVKELKDRFGLAAISFDATTPTAWRPYYLRMLGVALTDLQRVLPAFGVRGLGIHFGESPMRDAALAMHDPARRTIFLPIATSAGVIAHELAHDLDWQTARTRYGLRGTYSTDRAVRQYRDRLAASVLELRDTRPADSSLGTDGVRPMPSARPTEVFARNVDWFVSAVLAGEGRMNGYLSAVQDGLLTGYGAVAVPEVARDGAQAMIRALDEMTIVTPATRAWFVDTHGRGRAVPIADLTRRVLDVPLMAADRRIGQLPRGPGDYVLVPGEVSARTLVALGAGCRAGVIDERLAEERERVLLEAADARARGLLARRARFAASAERAPWQSRALLGNAWSTSYADRARLELRDAILRRAVLAGTPRGATALVAAAPLGCSLGS